VNILSRLKQLALPLLAGLAVAGCTQLGAFNAVIPHDRGVRLVASDIAYGAESRQRLDIYRPPAIEASAGVIVFVYGGSWSSGRKQDYAFVAKALAAGGFVTVLFDYRLVPDIRYPVFVEDAAKAVAWTYRNIEDYGGDPERLFLAGHSAGAYSALMVALAPEFLAAEGLPASVVKGIAGLSGPYDFLPLDSDATRAAFGGFAQLERTQPVNRVSGDAPPLFLATGEADTLVYPRNTRALAKAARQAGVRVETRFYSGVDHAGTLLALSRPLRNRAPVLEDVTDFFAGL
jgi:acetyl esterase/lipase